MSVYKSAASIFRERLFDNKDGLIWMWNLPELNQSNLHFWFLSLFVFAFFFIHSMCACTNFRSPNEEQVIYYLLYYSLRLVFITIIQNHSQPVFSLIDCF